MFTVERASDHQPSVFMGFLAVGDEVSKVKLEAAAKAAGFHNARAKNDKEQDEVMVFFPLECERSKCMALYHDALNGRFGKFAIEVMLIPQQNLADGFQVDKDVEIDPPSQLVEPAGS